jgi:ATP-dependent DNA helicase RecG
LLHGRLGAAEKRSVLARFASADIDLLVATTIVEVGVDVGGAGILVVEDAECFGLSQLHQLRGRIGRDGRRGYCFLLTNSAPESEARKRLQFFRGEHDGFAVAEADLRLRGPGEVLGVRQTGWDDLKLADMVRDASLFREIRQTIEALAADSPAKLHN